jgi:hypothetical protein
MPSFAELEICAGALLLAGAMMLIYYHSKKIFRRRPRRHLFVFLINRTPFPYVHVPGTPAGILLFLANPMAYVWHEKRKGGDFPMNLIQAPAGAVSSVPQNVAVVLDIVFLEADDNGNVLPGVGPFTTQVDDPAGAVTVSADQKSLSISGSGPAGDVTVTITDTGNNLVGKAVLSVTPVTPPPPSPTQAAVFFVPETPATSAASGGSSVTPEVKH